MGLFKVRRTTTPGLIPAGLTYGEMAVNLADRILYVGGTAENAIEIAGGSGNYRFFYQADAPGLSQGYGITGETGQYDYLIGSRWIDSDTGREYVYIGDGDQWYWVEPPGGGGGAEGTWIRPDATTATDVAGIPAGTTGLVGESSIQILERILYPYQNVTLSWVGTPPVGTGLATQYELGQTAGNGTFTAHWSSSSPVANWISNSAYIRYTGLATGTALTAGSPTANSASVQYPAFRGTAIGNSVSFSLTGQQVGGTNKVVTAAPRTSTWYSKIYWGKSTNPNLTNPLALTSGGDALFASTGSRTINTTDAGGYLYFFIHNNYTLTSMKYAGFDVALNAAVTGSVTNAQGLTTTYKIYRSFFQLPGALTDIAITTA